MRSFFFTVSAFTLVLVFSLVISGQRRSARKTQTKQPTKVSVDIGIYVGKAANLTKKANGEVTLNIYKFDRKSGNVEASVEFHSGLCGEGDLVGIIDEEGMTLNGVLTCSNRVRNLVTRCRFTGGENIACTYTLKQTNATQVSDKGNFELRQYSDTYTNAKSSSALTTPSSRVSNTTTVKKIYKVVFPTGDFKVDLAMVNQDSVVLKASPDSASTTVKTLSPGDLLTLLSRTPVNGWLRVIDYNSGTDGWIQVDSVETKYGTIQNKEKYLERTVSNYGKDPSIYIKNDTNRTMNFGFGNQSYTLGPYQSLNLDIKPGTYQYYVSSPEVIPIIGEEYFQSGYKYTWSFYIETK